MFAARKLSKAGSLICSQLARQPSRSVNGMMIGKPRVRGSPAEKVFFGVFFVVVISTYPVLIAKRLHSYSSGK